MAWLLTFAILLVSLPSYAVPQKIEIDSKLVYNGRRIASPRILARTGERSKIIMNDQKMKREYNLEVLPTQRAGSKINLLYFLTVRDKGNETLSRGSILLPENKKGLISLDQGNIKIFLKIKK